MDDEVAGVVVGGCTAGGAVVEFIFSVAIIGK